MTPSRTLLRAVARLLIPALLLAFTLLAPAAAQASGWTGFTPVTGSPGAGRTLAQPKLTSDSAGNQVAVWIEQPSPFKVVAAFRPAGGAWGAPQTLDSVATSAPNTDVAVDGNGNFIVVYSEVVNTTYKVFSAYLPTGQSAFEAVQQVGGTLSGTATISAPAVAFDGQGRAFTAYGISGGVTWAGIRAAGSAKPWTQTSNGLPTNSANLDIAVSSVGEATIVDFAAAGGALRYYRLQNGGATWTALTIPPATGNPTGTPLLAIDDFGRTTALHLVASTFTQIASQTCPAGVPATCASRVQLTQVNALTSAASPALSLSSAGDAAATWTENTTIAVARRTGFAGSWGAPVNAGSGANPVVRFSSGGALLSAYGESTNVVKFLLASPGAALTPPSSNLTDPAQPWKSPAIAADGSSDFFGVWLAGAGDGIQSAVYDAQAPAMSAITAPGTAVTGEPVAFATNASDTWSGVSYSWDFGDGGTDSSASPTHTYATPGSYTARVTATDGAGNQASRTRVVDVSAPPVVNQRLPRPIAGQTVNLEPVAGVVLVKVPGSTKFVPLVAPTQVRDGSIIDARKGRVRITIDNGRGGLDTADFYGGIFKFTQPRVKPGLTRFANLYLYAGSFRGCPRAPRNPKVASLSRKKQSQSRSVRHLWGSGEGAFRTVGRFSSATVRGTTWLTDDHCNGTLTKVTAGKVGVRDFVLKKTIVVKKGKRYFARPAPAKKR